MPSADDIAQQQELLRENRRTLAHLIRQAAQYGGIAFAPPVVANAIAETRAAIAGRKAALRGWGAEVENLPDDAEDASTASQPGAPGSRGAGPVFHFNAPIHSGATNFGGEQRIEELNATMGDNISISHIAGSVLNIKSTLTNVTQRVDGISGADEATKDKLKRLMAQLSGVLQQVPPERAEDATKVAKRAEAAVEEVSKPRPDKELLLFNIDSLKKAAAHIAALIPDVLPIASKIAAHLLTLAG